MQQSLDGNQHDEGLRRVLGHEYGGVSLLGSYHPFNDAYYRALSICGDEVWVGYRHQTPENPLYDLPAGPITTVVQRFRVRGGALTFVSSRSHDSD